MTQDKFAATKRIDKTLNWLEYSREQWKEKCMEAKLQLKRQTLATKRVREGRVNLKNELRLAQNRIKELESISEQQSKQIDELKKKCSSKRMM